MRSLRRRLAPETAPCVTLAERVAHLSVRRRRELKRIVRILFDEFEEAQRGKTSDRKKGGRILKLVLFGPHAQGDRGGKRERSCACTDYNLLVVNTDIFTSPRIWKHATERFRRELTITGHLSARVNFIVHSIMDINDLLANGRPFFADIVCNGIRL